MVAPAGHEEKQFQQILLTDLRASLTSPVSEIGNRFRSFVIENLSIDPNCSLKPWKNGSRWLTVTDNAKGKAKVVVSSDIWHRAVQSGYTITNDISIDVAIESLFLDKRMQIQINAMAIRVSGQSQMEAKRDAINQYCINKNYFNRKKVPIPVIITRIAIITTKYSDIESDITKQTGLKKGLITSYRFDGTPEGLQKTLVNIIGKQKYDIITLYRGGREDESMFVFSDPVVLDEIVKSPVPIASALGHERDIPPVQRVVSLGCASPSKFALYVKERNDQAWAEAYQLTKEINYNFNSYLEKLKGHVFQQYTEITNITAELQRLAEQKRHRRNMVVVILFAVIALTFVIWYLT